MESDDFTPFGRNENPDGPITTIEHENGTVHKIDNFAIVDSTWNGIQTTDDLVAFLNRTPLPSSSNLPSSSVERQVAGTTNRGPIGYPAPAFWTGLGGGFLLSGQGYEDVAVLSVPTFDAGECNCAVQWQDAVGQFLQGAKQLSKTKLVIDLRGNQGGYIAFG